MRHSPLLLSLLGVLGLSVVLAAACAPAATPRDRQQGTTPQGAPAAEPPKALQVSEEKSQAKPQAPAAQEKKVASSVSGIPLDPDAKPGGTLQLAYTAEGPTFSTWEEAAGIAFTIVHPVSNMIVQNRAWGTPEDYRNLAFFEIHPDLAKSWEVSPDGLTWIFKFRDGVKWSDGKPFTCADAKWSLDTIRTGQGLTRSPRALHFNTVKEITCPDDLTMAITHKRPKAAFLEIMAFPYDVVRPKHVYENNMDLMRTRPPDVGTGPFTLKEWLPSERYLFQKNPDYWDKPFPYLDGIEYKFMTLQASDVAFRTGRVHISTFIQGGRGETLMKECKECFFFDRAVWSGFPSVMTHHQRPPWNTPEIKDAISYAIDRTRVGKVAQGGWEVPPTAGIYYPGGPWDMPDDRLAQIPGYNFADPEGNKQKARELLARAGYRPGELTINFSIWNTATVAAEAVVIQEELQSVGFKVNPILLETARAYATWTAGDFDVGLHSFWVAGLDPDIVLYEQFYTGSDRNYNRYSNPEVDRLIDQQSATTDPELRRQRAWDVGEIILKEHAKHIIGYGSSSAGLRPEVRGYMYALNYLYGYGPWFRYQHVWLDDAK